jgi:hypothetical protein
VEHRLLTTEQFQRCFAQPMQDITGTAESVLDIWPYVDSLDLDTLGVERVNDVRSVYLDGRERLEHVCIGTSRFNALLVIVVDRVQRGILGHHLLNLNEEYGVAGAHLRGIK